MMRLVTSIILLLALCAQPFALSAGMAGHDRMSHDMAMGGGHAAPACDDTACPDEDRAPCCLVAAGHCAASWLMPEAARSPIPACHAMPRLVTATRWLEDSAPEADPPSPRA